MVYSQRLLAKVVVVMMLLAFMGDACEARPVVFLTDAQIKRTRERIQTYDWAKTSYSQIKSSAKRWMSGLIQFPQGPTGWYHDYFCPDHGVQLVYDPEKPCEHYCPAGKHYVHGEKLDAYWRATRLREIVQGARDIATVYVIEGDQMLAKAVVEILVSFADYYEKYIQDRKPPRLMWQTLDEATYILHAVAAYELVYDSGVLSAEDRSRIEEKWLRPTAEFIKSQTQVIHNIHCWQNSAILCIGLVLADESLVDFAINNPRSGFRRQIAEGVLDDGMWYECSFGYHFYTISALENTIVAAMNNRIDISKELAKINKMFEVPILCADKHFELPSPNDGSGGRLWHKTGAYELAYFLFPEEQRYGRLLKLSYIHSTRERGDRSLLFYGVEELPRKELQPVRESVNLGACGLGILRSWRGDDCIYACMDYGPQGGGHGHPDKLNVILSGLGQVFSPDLGSAGYGLKIHRDWYRQSLSHNVVVVDMKSQRPSAGELLDFRGGGEVNWISARANDAYPGVQWQRTMFLCNEGYVVIADSLWSEKEHLYDWAYHGIGKLGLAGVEMEAIDKKEFGSGNGYDVPTRVEQGKSSREIKAVWTLGREKVVTLRIAAPATGLEEVISAVAPGNPLMVEMPMIVQRKRAKTADFWVVIEPVEGTSRIERTVLSEGKLTVELNSGKRKSYFVERSQPGFLDMR